MNEVVIRDDIEKLREDLDNRDRGVCGVKYRD